MGKAKGAVLKMTVPTLIAALSRIIIEVVITTLIMITSSAVSMGA